MTRRPLLEGLRPAPGSGVLLSLRWLLVAVVSAPAWGVAWRGVAEGPAVRPYFTEVAGRLPFVHLLRLREALPSAWVPVLLASVLLAVLLSAALNAGALAVLSPTRPRTRWRPLLADLWRAGRRYLPAFLRVLLVEVVLIVLGLLALRAGFSRLELRGWREGWSGHTEVVVLPTLQVLLSVGWVVVVGAWAFSTRAVVVVSGDRRVRRAALATLRVWRRCPGRGPLFYAGLTLGAALLLGGVLVAWRQAPPASVAGAWARLFGWGVLLVGHAWIWHWLHRSVRLLAERPAVASVTRGASGR